MNRLESDGTYTYDAEGNVVERRDPVTGDYTEYTWDHRNRLVEVAGFDSGQNPTLLIQYYYDAFDRRVVMLEDADLDGLAGDVNESFVYDDGAGGDHGPGGGNQILVQLDASARLTHRYLWGPEPDQLLANEQVTFGGFMYTTDELLWTFADHEGSIRDVIDNAGTLRLHRDFTAFGLMTAYHFDANGQSVQPGTTGAIDVKQAFTGQVYEIQTGLQLHWRRWYDPATGRWMSEDWIIDDHQNTYRYVGNDPVNYVDPTGLYEDPPVGEKKGSELFNVDMSSSA